MLEMPRYDGMSFTLFIFLLNRKGNDCFGNKDYNKAIEYYTEGLKVDPNNAVLFSNRR